MKFGPTDREIFQRLEDLIVQTMQRCATLERALADGLANGSDTSAADAALEASYRALRIFKDKLHDVEQRLASRPDDG